VIIYLFIFILFEDFDELFDEACGAIKCSVRLNCL